MKKILYLLLIVFVACTKEEEEEQIKPEVQHASVVNNTSQWESIAFSSEIFSGRRGYSFESEIHYKYGDIENGSPAFMAEHHYFRSGGPEGPYYNYHITSGSEIFSFNLPFILVNKNASSVPAHITNELLNGKVDFVENWLFRSEGKLWSQGIIKDERFNSIYTIKEASFVKNMDEEVYGWMNYVRYPDFPAGYVLQGSDNKVRLHNMGAVDVIGESGNYNIYFMADFSENAATNPRKRGAMARKAWNSGKTQVDEVSILPATSNIDANGYPEYKTIALNENAIFSFHHYLSNDELEIFYGNFNNGFSLKSTIQQVKSITQVIKGKNNVFVIYSTTASEIKAIKITANGTVHNLGTIPYGIYSYYREGLVVATVSNLEEIEISLIHENNVTKLAEVGDITVGEASNLVTNDFLAFAPNGNDLYVAIQNWKSPKYKGALQFGGWEIIKYKN